MSIYQVNEKGYYGPFGGAYIPEMLYPNVKELREEYLKIIEEESFQEEFNQLLSDYVGRPSPLYHAKRLSEKYGTTIYLKREDLNHTGARRQAQDSMAYPQRPSVRSKVYNVQCTWEKLIFNVRLQM